MAQMMQIFAQTQIGKTIEISFDAEVFTKVHIGTDGTAWGQPAPTPDSTFKCPAQAGGLSDASTDARLNSIINREVALMHSAANIDASADASTSACVIPSKSQLRRQRRRQRLRDQCASSLPTPANHSKSDACYDSDSTNPRRDDNPYASIDACADARDTDSNSTASGVMCATWHLLPIPTPAPSPARPLLYDIADTCDDAFVDASADSCSVAIDFPAASTYASSAAHIDNDDGHTCHQPTGVLATGGANDAMDCFIPDAYGRALHCDTISGCYSFAMRRLSCQDFVIKHYLEHDVDLGCVDAIVGECVDVSSVVNDLPAASTFDSSAAYIDSDAGHICNQPTGILATCGANDAMDCHVPDAHGCTLLCDTYSGCNSFAMKRHDCPDFLIKHYLDHGDNIVRFLPRDVFANGCDNVAMDCNTSDAYGRTLHCDTISERNSFDKRQLDFDGRTSTDHLYYVSSDGIVSDIRSSSHDGPGAAPDAVIDPDRGGARSSLTRVLGSVLPTACLPPDGSSTASGDGAAPDAVIDPDRGGARRSLARASGGVLPTDGSPPVGSSIASEVGAAPGADAALDSAALDEELAQTLQLVEELLIKTPVSHPNCRTLSATRALILDIIPNPSPAYYRSDQRCFQAATARLKEMLRTGLD